MTYRGGQGGMTIPGGPLGKAKYALSIGRPDEAARLCLKLLEKDTGNVGARVVLAQALLQQNKPREAAAEARQAIRAQSTNVDAHLILASALLQTSGPMAQFRGVPEEALQAAKRAVDLQPRAAKTHVQFAEVLAAKRDMAGARVEADIAVKLEPRLAGAHLIRAIVLYTDKDPEGAVAASDAALRNDRNLTQAEFIKANALLDLRRYDEALSALDRVERTNAQLGGANTRAIRGRIYYKQRKFKQSYREFRQLQAANPRLRRLAPVLAGVSMVMVGQFGQSAQTAIVVLFAAVIVLALFGLHFIPVVGGWIVAVLVLAILGFFAFGAVRQSRGTLLNAAPGGPFASIGLAVVAFAAMLYLVFYSVSRVASTKTHPWRLDPVWLAIGGTLALVFSAAILYLVSRFANRRQTTAVA